LNVDSVIRHELDLVEAALREVVSSDVSMLDQAGRHIVGSGGKRLRPKLVLLSYLAAGGTEPARAVPLATVMELLHTASLVHDDINDHSDLRRGSETVNARWGNALALLVGDFIFVRMLTLLPGLNAQALTTLAECCTAIVEGEALQALHTNDYSLTEENYISIVAKKTASLFAACGQLGGALSGNGQTASALRDYGFNIGMAFQIRDDALDWVGKQDQLGKPVSGDLAQGKIDLTSIYALRRSDRARQVLASRDADQARALVQETGALEYAMARSDGFARKARRYLASLDHSKARDELYGLADFAVFRDH
jgi:geranylgeranyl pyrophosphate synthase